MDGRAGIFWHRDGPLPPEILDELQSVDQEGVNHYSQYAARLERHRPWPRTVQHRGLNNQFGNDFILWEPEQCVLPPLSVSLRAQIVQDTAHITVTQLFWNNSEHAVPRASYSMPLPDGCTVTDFNCRIGSHKVVKAKVKPKEEARNVFDRAVRNDRTAALLEQTTPDVFSTSLGNIPKRSKIRAEISFITLLKYEFVGRRGCTTLAIPASLASSCGNPQPQLRAVLPAGISQRLSINVEISAAERVQNISSRSHRVVVERRQGTFDVDNWEDFAAAQGENEVQVAFVTLEDESTFLDKEFVLEILTAPQDDEEHPQAWLESHPTVQNHKAVMLTIPPRFFLKNRPVDAAGEIVFVADRSGSMFGKMDSLKSAMQCFLMSIPQGRFFNLWSFGSDYSFLWPTSRPNSNQSTLEGALRHVKEDFAADMGGTELLPVLQAIVDARDERRTTDIVVLTDGHVFSMEKTIEYVQHMKLTTEGAVRVFALGIGYGVSHELVEGIAKAGGGYAEVIPSASDGGWESRVVAVLEAAVHGHLPPLRIQAEGIAEGPISPDRDVEAPRLAQRPRILKSPADLSTLSPFLRQRVYMLFDTLSDSPPLNHINIISTSEDGQESTTRVLVKHAPAGSVFIHKLGARAVLGDLEKGQGWIHLSPDRANRSSEEELVRSEGQMLGCKWFLVSKWTSFYAIDEPYRPDEHDQEPFMDVAHVQVPLVEEGMDLLRPRGLPNCPRDNVGLGLADAVHEIDDDSDEDDETSSDPEDLGPGPQDASDSDSDSDDEGGGGGDPRGGGEHNNESAGGGQPHPPERDDPDAGGNDSNTEVPGSGNGPTTTATPGTHSMAANTSASPPYDHADTISGIVEGRSQHRMCLQGLMGAESPGIDTNANLSPDAAAHKISYGAKEIPKDGASFRRGSSQSAFWPRTEGISTRSFPRYPEDPLLKPNADSKYSEDTRRRSSYETPALYKGSPDWDTKPSYKPHFLLSALDDRAKKPRHESHGGATLTADSKHSPYPRSDIMSHAAISAPQHNLPAATSLLPQQIFAPMTPEQKHGEQIVQKLLQYQRYDGSFTAGFNAVLAEILGDKFLLIVGTIQRRVPASIIFTDDVALTVAIVVLFEEKLQSCRDLWTMIHTKAQKSLDEKFGTAYDGVKNSLYAYARSCMPNFEFPKPGPASSPAPAPGHPPPHTSLGHPAPSPSPSAPQFSEPYSNTVRSMSNRSVYTPTQQTLAPAQPRNPFSVHSGQTPQFSPWASGPLAESPTQRPTFTSARAPAPAQPSPLAPVAAMNASSPETGAVPSKRYAGPGVSLDAAGGKNFHGWMQGDNTMPVGVGPETWSFGALLAREDTGGARVALDSAPGEDDLL